MVFQPVTAPYNLQKVLGQSPPVAVATVQQNNTHITLNGSASYSPEGSPISFYNWSQIDANQPVSLASNGSLAIFMAPNITGPVPVNYSFSLTVTDSNGLVSAPSVVNVTVNNINSSNFSTLPVFPVELPPHAIGTYPANGSTNIPIKADKFTATFDQDIEVNPTNTTIKDVAGNEIPIEVTTEGPTVTITPKSDLAPGTNYTVFINEVNGKGKTNVGSAFYTFTTAAEAPILPAELPPHAIGTYPANGSTNIPIKADKFTATFDQDIEVNPTNTTIKDVAGNEIPIEVTTEGPTVTITPKSDLAPGTNYTVFINEVNGKGKTNVGSAFYTFTTAAEAVPTTTNQTTTPAPPTTTPSQPTNHPPQALDQQVATEADKPIPIALGATDNDTGDSLSAAIVTKPQPDHGSLGDIDQNTGNVTYTPAPGFTGNDSFTFKVTDSHQAESNVATVSISVMPSTVPTTTNQTPPSPPTTTPSQPTNHPPQALDQQVATEADKPIPIALGATDNDTGDSLSAAIVTKPQPDHGSLGDIDQNTGNVTYTPAPGFTGNDSFTFKVTDSHQAESNVATVSISVKPSHNKAPIIEQIHSSVTSAKAGDQVKLEILDKELEDENLTSLSLNWKQISGQPPVNLTLSSDNRTASFTAPELKQNAALGFRLTATDEKNQSASKDITINIQAAPPNMPPEITISANITNPKALEGVKMEAAIKDENLTSVKSFWKQISGQPPVNLTLSSDNRTASFTAPELKQNAALGFRLTATDEKNQSASKDITINIQAAPPNMPPKVSAGSNQNVASGDLVKLIGTVSDEGTPKLTWIRTEGPSTDISLQNSNQKEASFIAPPVRSPTKLGFNFTAVDDKNQKSSSKVIVTVNPISLENDRDSDNDGIFNNVDKDISKPSTEFLDKLDQSPPQTFGKIVAPPGVTNPKVTVKDAANEQNGVVISVAPDAPGTVTVLACGSSSTVLGKGDIILLTCGSADIKVIQGDAFTKLNTSDGSVIQGTLTEGNLIIFDPTKRTLQADSGNAGVVDLSVTGNKKLNEIVLNAGKTVTLPPSGNAQTTTQTPKQPPTTTPPKQPPTTTPPKQPPTTTPPKQPPTTTPPKQPPTTTPPKQPPGGPTGAAPTVSIQPVLPVREGGTFVLDGSLSKGALPTEKLTFLWQQISGPTAKPVFGQNTPKATYQAPLAVNQTNVPMIFKLTAKNAKGVEGTSQISVSLVKGIVNARPIANAGIDRTVRENANVVLDGSKSSDPNGDRLSYQWIQTFGIRKVILNGSDTPRPSFTAPIVPLNDSALLFRLTVKDPAGLNSSDFVRVTVLKAGIPDKPPIANAGPDVAAVAGSNVTLFGNKSSDPDPKDVLAYSWKQIGGSPSVTLNSENLQTAWFKAPDLPANATLTFALTVTDKQRKNNTDYVSVTIFKPQGFPLWLIIAIGASAAAAGVAAWLLLFRKKPKPKTKFVP